MELKYCLQKSIIRSRSILTTAQPDTHSFHQNQKNIATRRGHRHASWKLCLTWLVMHTTFCQSKCTTGFFAFPDQVSEMAPNTRGWVSLRTPRLFSLNRPTGTQRARASSRQKDWNQDRRRGDLHGRLGECGQASSKDTNPSVNHLSCRGPLEQSFATPVSTPSTRAPSPAADLTAAEPPATAGGHDLTTVWYPDLNTYVHRMLASTAGPTWQAWKYF
jgi:hypothetical protein